MAKSHYVCYSVRWPINNAGWVIRTSFCPEATYGMLKTIR